ncbi:hypothetical protein TRIP_C20175 [Candidatus Zixiibacteriota bacterium]|nr:hypothetical protein TRIP_C20175 [candidate division Zixibacteria bacterium]
MLRYISALIFAVFPLVNANGDGNKVDSLINKYIDANILAKCDSALAKMSGYEDSAQDAKFFKPEIAHSGYLRIKDTAYYALLFRCSGFGQFLLIDSIERDVVRGKIDIQIPGSVALFNTADIKDINGDSIPELEFALTAGAHGYYVCYLSLNLDKLNFLKDDKGEYLFYAIMGGIGLIPTSKPNVFDIRVGNWLEKGQKANYSLYKWNGECYEFKEDVIY